MTLDELIIMLNGVKNEHGGDLRVGALDTYGDALSIVEVQYDDEAEGGPMVWVRHE